MKKIYNKLVRDKIPEIIEASRKSCRIEVLSDDEYLKMLDTKLDEELAEYHELFHWQSQSTTAEKSPTSQRYIHHAEKGNKILLFVREFKTDRVSGGAESYTYLGTANYVKHIGEKPMNITWKLDNSIPAKYLKKTNKLVVG